MKKMILTNIRICLYKKQYERMSEHICIKKCYDYDTNEYSYWKILEYIQISEYSSHPGPVQLEGQVLESGDSVMVYVHLRKNFSGMGL